MNKLLETLYHNLYTPLEQAELQSEISSCHHCIMRAAAATDAQSERPPCPVRAATLRGRCATYLK